MNVAGFAFGLLAAVFLLHLIWWQIRLPKSHTRALLLLFLGALPLALIANAVLPSWSLTIQGFWQHAQVCLFHITMSLAYVEFYTSIEEDSPTLSLLLFVERAGADGRAEEEMFQLIDDDFVVGNRLQSMVNSGVATRDDEGVLRLTPAGRKWARFFQFARWIYHLRLGG